MDQVFRAIEGNRLGSLKDCLRMTDFDEPLFDVLNRPSQEHGCTPLMYALKQPAILPEILEFLLESGSDTEAGPLGALHYAITCHQPCGVLKLLLDYKADIYRLGPLATDCPAAAARETVDDEKEVEGQAATYSLLHLALQVGAGREVVELLCREGGTLLINNQNNADRETPMIFAIKRGLKFHDLAVMSNLSLTDCNGLTAYSCAAATMDPMLCLQLECLGASAQLPSAQGFTFAQIRGALHRFHHPDLLHLEILFGRQGNSQHGEWFDYWGELLEHGGPEHVALPVDGWWQWCSDWQQANCLGEVKVKQDEDRTSRSSSNNSKATTTTAASAATSGTEQAFGILPPLEHCEVWFRLRKRRPLPPEFPDFFAQAIRLISAAETDFYENAGMTVIEPVLNGFKEAISLLMTGIRTCPDCPMKGRAADYLQLAMQRFDSLSELSAAAAAAASSQSSSNNNNCLFFASLAGTRAGSTSALPLPAAINTTPGLHVGADPRNASTASLPAVTKTFPLFHRSRSRGGLFSRSANKKTTAAGQDELKFCPVCSERLSSRVEAQRVEHLNACLTKSGGTSVLGDRYTVHVAPSPDPRECPICYEEFEAGERVAVMNCLCRFHERCIERWFRRSPTCPFHSE